MRREEDNPFYHTRQWKRVRDKVLKLDHYECVICREQRHRHTRAELVHHVWHLSDYPEYATEIYVGDRRNLISVCRNCHETVCHPERMRMEPAKKPLTTERW